MSKSEELLEEILEELRGIRLEISELKEAMPDIDGIADTLMGKYPGHAGNDLNDVTVAIQSLECSIPTGVYDLDDVYGAIKELASELLEK